MTTIQEEMNMDDEDLRKLVDLVFKQKNRKIEEFERCEK